MSQPHPLAAWTAAFPSLLGWSALQLVQALETPGLSDELGIAVCLAWQRQVALLNWNTVVEKSLRAAAPALTALH